jgi:hypothetical protein
MDYDTEFWGIVYYFPTIDEFIEGAGQADKSELCGQYPMSSSLDSSLGRMGQDQR